MASLPDSLKPNAAGKERVSQAVLEEHQSDRVLVAAIKVFAKRGYPGTTVDHIVQAAKIGVGNFYKLFGGKEECFLRCYERIVDEARTSVTEAIPADAGWGEQACAALRSLLEQIEAEPLRARLALLEVQTAGPEALSRYQATLDEAIPLLARGREESEVADELPARLEEAISGGLAWYLQQRVVSGEFGRAADRLPEALEIVVEPYLGAKATAKLI